MKGIINSAIQMFKGDVKAIKAYLRLRKIKVTSELIKKRIAKGND